MRFLNLIWPDHPEEGESINKATKYVVSSSDHAYDWEKTIIVKDNVVDQIKKLKAKDGPELQVHGSGNLIQTLLKNNLVDELWLKIYPLTLGRGKRLFAEGTVPSALQMVEGKIAPNGVIVANYKFAGEVKTGSF